MGRVRGLATAAIRCAAPASAAPPRAPDQQAAALVSALKVCGSIRDLRKGKAIHAQAVESKQLGIHVVNALVDMYAKCGSMEDSRRVFDSILHPNVMSWNVLMLGYVSNGESDVALDLFERMQARRSGCKPNSRSFMAASKACSSLAAKEDAVLVDGKLVKEASLETGRGIHSQAKQMGPSCSEDVFLSSSLIDMYSKCGSMLDARSVFDEMPRRDVVSWNALILGYVENGESEVALEFFGKMDCSPNSRTFVAAAKACANLAVKEEATQEDGKMVKTRSLEKGLAVHAGAMASHCCGDIFVGSSLVDMYSKCGSMADARMVFESMPRRDVVLWTSLMQGFVDNGESELALVFFEDMKLSGCCPNSRTYVAALAACASSAMREEAVDVDGKLVKRKSLETGVAIQGEASNNRCCEDVFVGNTLIDMYAKCGKLEEARKVFDGMAGRDVVSWNAMIQGSVGSGDSKLALELFFGMENDPDERTFIAALMACVHLSASEQPVPREDGKLLRIQSLEKGMEIHSLATKLGCCEHRFVGSSLVDMYAKCGDMVKARAVFKRMPSRDVVVWTSLIQGYVDNGESELGLELLESMDCAPNSRTLVAGLTACGNVGSSEAGRKIQAELYRRGLEDDQVVGTCMVNFYGKCGVMSAAEHLFGSLAVRDIVAWNAMITGFGQQGDTSRVFEAFREMREDGVRANAITFVSVITACSHGGLVERGREFFQAMDPDSGIVCGIHHYSSLVDLFGRANRLEEAVKVLESMPLRADAVVWRSVLGACRKWKNVEVGRIAFEALTKIDEKDSAAYVLMASIYRSAGLWEDHDKLKTIQEAALKADRKSLRIHLRAD
ncbi:pentatricopeptide repeat-containing protein At2g13600-like [Selaginella moellendorffii]|uniref:pentatricopeptide repeat-containing protein At2g13600-like n=1 Tax=Selaginella moellendorffii TaxID=88036 RepID=UPI000D1C8FBB|nr:pentatricopeptide repeat-containing protein At2g13600-like [Selaginella moellendorffii]|eukprot:XP_024524808.1 pentatricopeptide repeat-containing protein At2g13600-like [Selaginella moellendorffii]